MVESSKKLTAMPSDSGSRDGESHDTPGEQDHSQWEAEPAAPGRVLLDGHHDAEGEHTRKALRTDHEHQEHERPAAADAEQTVVHAQSEGFPAFMPSLPVLDHEAEWRSALVQAAVLQRRELIETRDNQNRAGDH